MSRTVVDCGFLALVDCAPLVIAREMGFAAEEGLDLVLHREASWSALRDKLALERLTAAHMLSPVPVAMSMGIGGLAVPIDALMVLSVNGNTIGVSGSLAAAMRARGVANDVMAAESVGRTLIAAAERQLRVGVPFPVSMHAELLYYWLGGLGLTAPQDLRVRTVPPPRMAQAMAEGEIDAFCVGEPWGSLAVEAGVAEIILPGCAIWRFAPEKVLAVRRAWVTAEPEIAIALMRAVWRAGRWLADPAHRVTASELLAAPHYLDVAAERIERVMAGRLVVTPGGAEREVARLVEFFDGAATFPWRSQAVWMASRLAARFGLDRAEAAAAARACFRPDLYRAALGPLGADLPGASEKLEGALAVATPVASSEGEMSLGPDVFFDGQVFDPEAPS
ncbi:MAG: CmpA/NrtA family ABC transporter substrate-binding protein [Pseudomonadota bacterium]